MYQVFSVPTSIEKLLYAESQQGCICSKSSCWHSIDRKVRSELVLRSSPDVGHLSDHTGRSGAFYDTLLPIRSSWYIAKTLLRWHQEPGACVDLAVFCNVFGLHCLDGIDDHGSRDFTRNLFILTTSHNQMAVIFFSQQLTPIFPTYPETQKGDLLLYETTCSVPVIPT